MIARHTRYATAVHDALGQLAHATNAELLTRVRQQYPDVSATTIHRVTARLAAHGDIGTAPPNRDGHERYDADPTLHHHFVCACCDTLHDIANTPAARQALTQLQSLSQSCAFAGSLTLSGNCTTCQSTTCHIA